MPGGGIPRANYAALVVAEIESHRFYPASALDAGDQGAVAVSFTIRPNGRIIPSAIKRSSRSNARDRAAGEILRSIAPPPPPGGSFAGSATVRFHFE
jgi:periplasmic protein TonB